MQEPELKGLDDIISQILTMMDQEPATTVLNTDPKKKTRANDPQQLRPWVALFQGLMQRNPLALINAMQKCYDYCQEESPGNGSYAKRKRKQLKKKFIEQYGNLLAPSRPQPTPTQII